MRVMPEDLAPGGREILADMGDDGAVSVGASGTAGWAERRR
jgi:hypothetical protein